MEERNQEPDLQTVSLLIPRAKQGEEEAQNDLIEHLQGYLAVMAARNLDPALKQKLRESDIVQMTLANAVKDFDAFRGTSSAELRGWLKAIMVNQINTLRRQYHTAKRSIRREESIEKGGDDSPGLLLRDKHRTPSSETIAKEEIELLHKILDELPEDYAEVIRLRSLKKLPFEEVAQHMGRSYDATSKLWYRAMLKFEELMQQNRRQFEAD